MVKLLGLDMDGTTLNSDVELSPANREAIIKAIDKGVTVVPVTGRSFGLVPKEVLNIPGIEFLITSNGAAVEVLPQSKQIYREFLPKEKSDRIISILGDYDTFDEIIIDGVDYIKKSDMDRMKDFIEPDYWDLIGKNSVVLEDEEFDKKIHDSEIEKITFRLPLNDESQRFNIFNRINEIPDLITLQQAEGTNEITSSNANKGSALAYLGNKLGLDCSEIMAVGDSNNDIPMLTFADIGVAMGQAEDHVKRSAKFETLTNDEDGVARAIEHFILNGDQTDRAMPDEIVKKIKKVYEVA